DLPLGRRVPRSRAAAGGDGGADPPCRPRAPAADDAVRRAAARAGRPVVRRAAARTGVEPARERGGAAETATARAARRVGLPHVPEHQDALQLRAADDT